ncbi:MAG: YCF48-related protein [Bacteroidota bacterium]
MKKHLLLFITFFISSLVSFAQQYREMIDAGTYSVYEVQAVADPYFELVGTGKGTGYTQYKRWEYNALHSMDENGYLQSTEALLNEYFENEANTRNSRTMDTSNWLELGPTTWNSTSGWNPGVGRITSFAVDPDDQNHIVVGSQTGGVWRTTDGGTNWTVLTDSFTNMDAYALAIHPVNKDTYYWGSSSGIIFRTTDAGANWSQWVNLSGADVNKILIHPTSPDIVFVSVVSGGIFRTTNGGSTWSGTLTSESTGYDIEFKPGDTNTVYASGNGFYRSTDGGASFSQISSPFTAGQTKMIGVSANGASTVYVVEESNGIFGGIYVSGNSGASFTELSHSANYFGYSDTGGDSSGQAPRDMDIVVSPTNVNEVHIAGIHSWRSFDGGATFELTSYWTESGAASRDVGYCHADIDIMEFVGNNLYVGSDGGIFVATNSAEVMNDNFYTDLTFGLGIRQFYRIGVSQTNPEILVGGSQDNGSSFYNTSGNWFDWLGADGMEGFVDKNNNDIFYGTSQNGTLYKSTNGGQSRFNLATPPGSGNWVTPFEQDPTDQDVIYVGYDEVYKSTNGGFSWSAISQDFGPNMDYLKIAPSNNQIMYGSVDGNLYKTTDGGATNWTSLSGYSGTFINDIAIHPSDPNRVAIATNNTNRVFVSTDGGSSWTPMKLNLPNYTAYSLVWQNTADNRLFVGMNYGIYYIDDNLTQWQVFANNLPNVRVYEMEINTSNGMLYAGTYGRGAWRSLLPDIASDTQAPTAPTNLVASNIAATSVDLDWTASTDNIGVTGYEVFQDGVSIATVPDVNHSVTGLTPATTYDFTVRAFDAAGNDSPMSNTENVTTSVPLPVPCANTVSSVPYSESFETPGNLGFWMQPTAEDDGDWVQDNLGTPSTGTGPSTGSDGDYYLFLEASTNGSPGEIGANAMAILEGPCIQLSTLSNVQFTFDYHAYGDSISTASLIVEGSVYDGIWFELLNLTNFVSQNTWISESIDLSSYNEDLKIRIKGTTGGGWSSDLAIDHLGFTGEECAGDVKTWNGVSWSPSGAPGSTNALILNGNYDTGIHGNIEGCTLTVNTGSTLNIAADSYMRIENDITVNGNLLVAHTGNLVQTNETAQVTNNGTINVYVTTPNLESRDFLVMGSPVSAETRNGVFVDPFLVLDHNTLNFVPHPDVTAQFPGAENFADDNNDFWSAYNGSITPGRGFIVRPQAGFGEPGGIFNYTFQQGTLNSGMIDFNVLYNTSKNDSPNVLANPYASAISADAFIAANPMIDEVYFWEHLTAPNPGLPGAGSMNFSMQDISMYNLMGGTAAAADITGTVTEPNGVIATAQGFGVKATAAGTASFSNAMRLTSGNNTLRAPEEKDRVWLQISTEEYNLSSNTLIGFSNATSPGLDMGYDSRRLASVLSLYSHLDTDVSKELGIQSLGALKSDSKVLLGFSSLVDTETDYKITMIKTEGSQIEDMSVFLYDNELNLLIELTQQDYSFSSNKGTFHERFTLLFENKTLGTPGIINELSVKVYPNPTTGKLQVISLSNREIAEAQLLDLQGRVLTTFKVHDFSAEIDLSEFSGATYLLKLISGGEETIKRVVKE